VVIFAPYYVERITVVTDPAQTGGNTLLDAFGGHKVAVAGDSLADLYLMGAFGGLLHDNVVHFLSVEEAVAAMQRGEVAGVMAQRSEIEGALKENRGKYRIVEMPTPGLLIPRQCLDRRQLYSGLTSLRRFLGLQPVGVRVKRKAAFT
jgi:ABC-type amino acid transport substrate-binding protein